MYLPRVGFHLSSIGIKCVISDIFTEVRIVEKQWPPPFPDRGKPEYNYLIFFVSGSDTYTEIWPLIGDVSKCAW